MRVVVQGLVPYVPPHRPRARARWWEARGTWHDDLLTIPELREGPEPPAVVGIAGLAAPCSLPAEFTTFLGLGTDWPAVLAALAAWTPDRFFREARRFAAGRTRGTRHPRRVPGESASAIERRRLARFAAARPLLAAVPVRPWAGAGTPALLEVDTPALLARLGLPASELSGDTPAPVMRRARILSALREGVLGFPIDVVARDLAVTSAPALESVLAAALAAWTDRTHPTAPPPDAPAWIPLP